MGKKLRSIKRLFRIEEHYEGYQSIYLFPYTMLSTLGYSYLLQHFFPAAQDNRTHFSNRLLLGVTKNPAAREALGGFFRSTANMNHQVFDEDHAVCKRFEVAQQEDSAS